MEEIKNAHLIRTIGGKRMVHIVTCPYIQDWDVDGCESIEKIKWGKMYLCPTCEKNIILYSFAKDYIKHKAIYDSLFEDVSANKVRMLLLDQKSRVLIDSANHRFYVSTKKDDWYIDYSLDEIHLYHGNYDISKRESSADTDFRKSGYHEHLKLGGTFNSAISYIIRYDYNKAEKAHKNQRKKQRKVKFSDITAEYEF